MEYLKLLFLSMVPIIELRGSIPIGIAMDLEPISIYNLCDRFSIISVPVVLMFRQIIDFLRYRKYFNKVIRWIDKKIEGRAKKLKTASIVGLIVFVGVPLPTTGSWSGAALASIFKMRILDSLLGIFVGNAIAGAIILIVWHVAEGTSIELILVALIVVVLGCYFKRRK
ncbi:MAG: COG2426 family protein [Intestinibacter bartlettii]